MANPARALLPLASAIWSLRTLTLTAQILLDPKLGFLGTMLEQHSHKHMARAPPTCAALSTLSSLCYRAVTCAFADAHDAPPMTCRLG